MLVPILNSNLLGAFFVLSETDIKQGKYYMKASHFLGDAEMGLLPFNSYEFKLRESWSTHSRHLLPDDTLVHPVHVEMKAGVAVKITLKTDVKNGHTKEEIFERRVTEDPEDRERRYIRKKAEKKPAGKK